MADPTTSRALRAPTVVAPEDDVAPDVPAGRLARVHATIRRLPRPVRVAAVSLVGGAVVLAGVAMLVLPGPGILTIVAGLAILASEFRWARRLLDRVKAAARAGVDKGREALRRQR